MTAGVPAKPAQRSFMDKLLDGVERVGNKVPHPVLMFAYLILLVIVALVDPGLARASASPTRSPCRCRCEVLPNYYEDLSQPSMWPFHRWPK